MYGQFNQSRIIFIYRVPTTTANMKLTEHIQLTSSTKCFLFLLTFHSVAYAQNQQPTINLTTEYLYPLNMSDKDNSAIYGQAADKVHELFKRSQVPYQMAIMSWNRAIELARKETNTCVFSTARTKERESSFQWVGPIATGNWSIFGSPDKLGKVTRLEDIAQFSIGTEAGNVSINYLSERGLHVITSIESATTFKNVALGRIDFATAADIHGKKLILDNQLGDKVTWLFNYHTSDYYLACNPKMSAKTIALLNIKLREMKADGSYRMMDSKY